MPKIIVIPSARFVAPPSVPTLSATAVSQTTINLVALSLSGGDTTITEYRFERAENAAGPWSIIATQASGSYTDSSLSAGQTRYYRALATQSDSQASGYSTTASATTNSGAQSFTPNFPHFSTGEYVPPSVFTNASNRDRLAQCSLVVMNQWPSAVIGASNPLKTAIQAIKARVSTVAPAMGTNDPVHACYTVQNEVHKTDAEYAQIRSHAATNNLYLYSSGSSGTPLDAAYGGGTHYALNNTQYATFGGSDTFYEWFNSEWVRPLMITGGTFTSPAGTVQANDELDAVFYDNGFNSAPVSGDYDRNGATDSDSAATIAYRNGIKLAFEDMRARSPELRYLLLNCSDQFYSYDATLYSNTFNHSDYSLMAPYTEGFYDGGLASEPLSAVENQQAGLAGWYHIRNRMRMYYSLCAVPALAWDVTWSQYDTSNNATNWRALRFWLAAKVICSDGPFGDQQWLNWSSLPDEYVGGSGGVGVGWLGAASEAPQWSVWQALGSHGVYRRRFANGWAIVNPKGNGAVTVNLGQQMRKLTGVSGRSDLSVNDGSLVTSVTLADRDAIFLRNA